MKRQRKKYASPTRPFDKQRLERELESLKNFGLKRKTELWKMEAVLRTYRRLARELAASRNAGREKILVDKLIKMGVLGEGATLDDVLGLTIEKLLERRLPNLIFKKGLTNSLKQARQLVTHGHVIIGGRKISHPNYLVPKNEEDKIEVDFALQPKKTESPVNTVI
ncbi:MAG: 30S ribosomal protein S4 [Candidatus Aenigmarchaeota archaeon]|nr:30S ribosomal protein S4 [Candidatus Aenigmarchaeota archaeon]